jgi:hypothetical protein
VGSLTLLFGQAAGPAEALCYPLHKGRGDHAGHQMLLTSARETDGTGGHTLMSAALCEQGTLSGCYPHEAVTAVGEQRSLSERRSVKRK